MEGSTDVARKILSCVARVDQRYGVGQVVQVLRGADTEAVRRWGHERLSTYGLLRDVPEKVLTNLVYQLVDQDVLVRSEGDRPVLRLNDRSLAVLRGDETVRLVEPRAGPVRSTRAQEDSWEGVDRVLFECLRELRRTIARERDVPPYVVFGDQALRSMARMRPGRLETMREVKGVGEKKLADLGPVFVDAVRSYCTAHDVPMDVDVVVRPPTVRRPRPNARKEQAMELFGRGAGLDEVTTAIGRAARTVVGYLVEFIEHVQPARIDDWVDDIVYERVEAAVAAVGADRLRPIYEHLGEQIDYDEIQITLAHLRTMQKMAEKMVEEPAEGMTGGGG